MTRIELLDKAAENGTRLPSAQPSQALSQQLQSFRKKDAPLTDLQKSTAATTTGKQVRKNAFLHSR